MEKTIYAEIFGEDYTIIFRNNHVNIFKNNAWAGDAYWDPEYEVILDCSADLGDSYEENSEIYMQLDSAISEALG